jgi:hypothetical protein
MDSMDLKTKLSVGLLVLFLQPARILSIVSLTFTYFLSYLNINPLGVDYNKTQTQRKKFRHKTSKVYLERKVSANNKITLHFSDTKQTQSPR